MNDADIYKLLNERESDGDMGVVRAACAELMKRFDTVQIFCTRYKPGENDTVDCTSGIGNWSARYGQVSQWMKRCDAYEASKAVGDE